jgi:hypothetical protein
MPFVEHNEWLSIEKLGNPIGSKFYLMNSGLNNHNRIIDVRYPEPVFHRNGLRIRILSLS